MQFAVEMNVSEFLLSDVEIGAVNLGSVVNSATGPDTGPALSFDETTLFLHSLRPDSMGFFDLYMSTRVKLK